MNGQTHRWILLFLVLLLSSCTTSSPLKKKLLNGEIPRYEGIVTPISIPIKPEYKPAEVITQNVTVTLQDGKAIEASTEMHCNVSEIGPLLIWNMKVLNMKQAGRYYSPGLPIVEARVLTDKTRQGKGKVNSVFPLLRRQVLT